MDKFQCIQAFVRVAETRSFVEAARQLHVTASVITARVKQMEDYVQTPLFHRSTRAVTLSEAGANFFEECADIVSRMDSVMERMRLMKGTPTGVLRLQVLPGFALGHLGSALKDFSEQYPHIELDITVSDVPINPIDKGYDVALQIFRPNAEVLVERSLFRVRRVFCASPAYIERNGMPTEPNQLLHHRLGLYSAYPTRDRWTFKRRNEEVSLVLPAALRTNSVHMLRDFALSGGGVTCVPTLVCGDDLLTGRLIPVLGEYHVPPLELLAIYPATHRRALKVKLFVDFIATRFSGEPEWDKALRALSQGAGARESNEATGRHHAGPEEQ